MFNQTVENITTLSNRKFIVPDKICSMIAQTNKNKKYHVTTIHGQSEEYYTHNINHPVHGSGHGSGKVGSVWNFISFPFHSSPKKYLTRSR